MTDLAQLRPGSCSSCCSSCYLLLLLLCACSYPSLSSCSSFILTAEEMEISLSLSFSFFSSSSSSGGYDEALSGWLPRCANRQLASANSGDSPAHSLAYPLPNQHAPP